MTGRARKYLLSGYLAVAMAGIVYTLNRRHELLALLPSMTAQHQSLSWPMVASMVAFILTFAGAVFFSAPINPLFYLAAGYLFGFATGSVLAIMANILGSGTSLYLFRKTTSPPPALQRHEVKNVFLTLVLLRCSPWFPSPLINVFCGMARVPLSTFLASTVLGTLPLVCTYTLFASRLRGPLTLSILQSPELITALTVLTMISFLGFLQPIRVVVNHLRGSSLIMIRNTMATSLDKRRYSRVIIPLAVEYQTRCPVSGDWRQGQGVMRDISLSGAFFHPDQAADFQPGQLLSLTIAGPLPFPDALQVSHIKAEGEVVRLEPPASANPKLGVAVNFFQNLTFATA